MRHLLTGNYPKRLSVRFYTKVPLRIALRASKGYSFNNISVKTLKLFFRFIFEMQPVRQKKHNVHYLYKVDYCTY